METFTVKNGLFIFHVFLYLGALILLARVLLNQLTAATACERPTSVSRIDPVFFAATLFLLLISALLLAYGVVLLANGDVLLPPLLQQAAGIGSAVYWFLLACFIAIWGRCFG